MADVFGRPRVMVGPPIIPPKVQAAQEYLRFAESLKHPIPSFDGCRGDSRELTNEEETVYKAALEVLRLYFSGEQNFDLELKQVMVDEDSGPQQQSPINV